MAITQATCSKVFWALGLLTFSACSSSGQAVNSQARIVLGQFGTDASYFYAVVDFARLTETEACTTLASDGPCTAVKCVPGDTTSLEGGSVTIEGKSTVTLARDADGRYAPTTTPSGNMFDPGQKLAFSIAGNQDDPPAFSFELQAPGYVLLDGPPGPLDRNQDATFTWSPSFGDQVAISIGTPTSEVMVTCNWPMAAGKGTLTSSVLRQIPNESIRIYHSSESTKTETRSGWRVTVIATEQHADVIDLALR
jgi:hypothetical protein